MILPEMNADDPSPFYRAMIRPDSVQALALGNSGGYMDLNDEGIRGFDTPTAHAAQIGGAGGLANGRGLARSLCTLGVWGHAQWDGVRVGRRTCANGRRIFREFARRNITRTDAIFVRILQSDGQSAFGAGHARQYVFARGSIRAPRLRR